MAIVVKAKSGDSSNNVIRKFKKKVQKTKLLTKLREREFYKKPSEKRKEKRKRLERQRRRNN
jgi:small subunit ribosomal protein S21